MSWTFSTTAGPSRGDGVGVGVGVGVVAGERVTVGCDPESAGVAVGAVAGCAHATIVASATASPRLRRRPVPSVGVPGSASAARAGSPAPRVADDLPAQLHGIERPLRRAVELPDAGDIVERDGDAAGGELSQPRAGRLRRLISADLGAERRLAGGDLQRSVEKAHEPLIAEVAGRDVDRHVQREPVLAPNTGLQQRLAQHPRCERVHEALARGGRQEGVRRDQSLLRMLPTDEGLDTAQGITADIEDRLVVELELVLRDRALQLEPALADHSSDLAGSSGCAPFHSVVPVGVVRPRWR